MFMETSAKTGYNARNVLLEASKMLYRDYLKFQESEQKNPDKNQIDLFYEKENSIFFGCIWNRFHKY